MAEVKAETAIEEIKRRRDEWQRRGESCERVGHRLSAIMSAGVVNGLELAIEILEAKGE